MKSELEKQLEIQLLTEKLQRVSGKKIVLEEGRVSDKDWDRMLDLKLTGKDGKSIAQAISNKDKAVARFIAGIKLEDKKLDYKEKWSEYSGSFSDFGNRALKLGATPEEIQKIFDETSIPSKYSDKLETLGSKDKKLRDRFVGVISKAILDLGFDIKFLPTNGYAITRIGKNAMAENGRKWTIGYKAEINKDNKTINLVFDAITDEGDGPTYYTVDSDSDILKNLTWKKVGQREFLTKLKEELK